MNNHPDRRPSAGRVILTVVEVGAIIGGGILGYRAYQNQNAVNAEVLKQLATLQVPGFTPTPGSQLPGETPMPLEQESPATQTPTPEAPKPVDRMSAWLNFWPDTAEKAATMFGGCASDWMKNPDWPGDKTAK